MKQRHKLPDQRQSYSARRPLDLPSKCLEPVEEPGFLTLVHALPFITDCYFNCITVHSQPECHIFPIRSKFERIGKQIEQNLLKLVDISIYLAFLSMARQ